MRKRGVPGSIPSLPHTLPRCYLCTAFGSVSRVCLVLVVPSERLAGPAGDARIPGESGRGVP